MANNFIGDPNCFGVWRMESAGVGLDTLGLNNLNNQNGVTVDGADYKEGAGSGVFVNASHQALYLTDLGLSSGFPFKTGDTKQIMSVAFWMKPAATTDYFAIFSKGGWNDSGLRVSFLSSKLVIKLVNASSYLTNIPIVAGEWYHIGIVINIPLQTLFVRVYRVSTTSIVDYTATLLESTIATTFNFSLGSYSNYYIAYTFDGKLDEFVVFNRELDPSEINDIRNGTYVTPGLPVMVDPVNLSLACECNLAIVMPTDRVLDCTPVLSVADTCSLATVYPFSVTVDCTPALKLGSSSTLTFVQPSPSFVVESLPALILGGSCSLESNLPESEAVDCTLSLSLGGSHALTSLVPGEILVDCTLGLRLGVSCGLAVWTLDKTLDCSPSLVLVVSCRLASSLASAYPVDCSAGLKVRATCNLAFVDLSAPARLDCTPALDIAASCGLASQLPVATDLTVDAILALGGSMGLACIFPATVVMLCSSGLYLGGTTWEAQLEQFDTWVLTGNNFNPSMYSGFNFNSYARYRGKNYAVGPDGLYVLEGADDDGKPIHSGVRIVTNFGIERDKRLRGINVGRCGDDAQVRVEDDNGNEGYFTPDVDHRAVVSRNLQGKQFTLDIFDTEVLSQLEITVLPLSKR